MSRAVLDLPPFAAWRHRGARDGVEVVFFSRTPSGHRAEGTTAAVDGQDAWTVDYAIDFDRSWLCRRVRVGCRSPSGRHGLTLESDGEGLWRIDGESAPRLDGCLDVDLESSALTNAFPVRRLVLAVGEESDVPAAYVRANDLSVERLEQRYSRLDDDAGRQCFGYAAPGYEFQSRLVYDRAGLVLDYPGIAVRAG
jgi:hypothetical protein